jgi:hypothetical protein
MAMIEACKEYLRLQALVEAFDGPGTKNAVIDMMTRQREIFERDISGYQWLHDSEEATLLARVLLARWDHNGALIFEGHLAARLKLMISAIAEGRLTSEAAAEAHELVQLTKDATDDGHPNRDIDAVHCLVLTVHLFRRAPHARH